MSDQIKAARIGGTAKIISALIGGIVSIFVTSGIFNYWIAEKYTSQRVVNDHYTSNSEVMELQNQIKNLQNEVEKLKEENPKLKNGGGTLNQTDKEEPIENAECKEKNWGNYSFTNTTGEKLILKAHHGVPPGTNPIYKYQITVLPGETQYLYQLEAKPLRYWVLKPVINKGRNMLSAYVNGELLVEQCITKNFEIK